MNTLRKARSWNVESLEARMLLAGDLVAHWNANDLIDSVQHGEAVSSWTDRINQIEAKAGGNPLLQEDAMGGRPVVQFDASDQKDWFEVEAANNPLTSANDFSVAVTFATTTTELTGARNSWHQGTGLIHSNRFGFAKDWGITLNSDGNASTGISGGFGQSVTSLFGNTALNDGSAHVVMMTRSAGTVTLYVNGDRIASESGGDAAPRDVMEFFIGVNDDHIGQLNADIGDVRVYDGALTDGEANSEFEIIQSFYNNQVPTAIDDRYTVNEDGLLFVVPGDGVLANDLDDDGDPLSAVLVSEPLNGAVTFNENGSFLYDPDRDFNGTDSFTYSAVDFRSSEPATVVIDVTPTRDAPFGLTDQYKLTPERPLTLPGLVGVLSNDLNADDLTIRAELATPPQFGQLTLRDDGGFTFDPVGQSGTATFSYRIVDDQSTSGAINVNLIVNSVPVANDDLFDIDEDTLLTLATDEGVLANDVDADGNSLTISILSDVQNGLLTVGENGSIAYEPNEHFFGIDTFGYIITDGIDSSQMATATIRVRATNDHPDAVDDAYFARVDSELAISADRGVLRNDSDVEDEALQASLVTQPANGTISISEQGAFTYQPNNGFTGEDTFQYAAIDADGARSEATVKLFVGNAPIRINEFMAVNASTLETRVREEPDDRFRGDSTTPDWVELVNRSQSSIDISGFHLTDSPTNTMAWSFPDGTVLPAGGYLLIFLDRIDISDTVLDESGIFHATFKLNAQGDYLALTSPDGTVLDEIETYPQQVADVSFGRTDDGFAYLTESSPGAANSQSSVEGIAEPTAVSLPAGYYSDAIEVSISSPDPVATIKYTIDGSEPTESNGTEYSEAIAIDKTTLLRTRAFADGMLPSISRTHSYLYLNDVLTQPDNPDGFPDTWGRAGAADYEIDPRIATDTDSEYFDADLRAALQSHDAISIVTDSEHLFDRTIGIYSNPQQQGVAWERPASMELFSSTGDLQFQINAGLRIQGGASRNPNRPKHNMRFLFKEQYGQSKLEFPFFEDSPITTIDTLILRGGNGDSWFHPNSNQQSQAQYIRDQWHKTTQQLMGHTFVPQRYIHLYVNGLYWGFYHTFEKPNASFFAERFGGQPEEYDAIQHQNGIVDGNRDKWNEVVSAVRADPEADETFEFVQQEVDVPALMEYLLLNFYSGNVDWDQNNWFGGRRREDGKFIFFTWDAERTFLGARDNRTIAVNANQPTDVHRRLYRANPEYRLQFADAAHRLFFNDGLLTPGQASERWQALADEIELPLTAESARWGDSKRARAPYTADVEWKRELNRLMTTYFPNRTETVLGQLRNLDLYPEVVAPTFDQHGGNVADGFGLTITAPDGVIYYTTDGSDVRLKGGQLSASARLYENNIPISQDTIVKSRVLMDGEWSALNEAEFLIPATRASSENLRVTEIHYNPAAASVDEIAAGFDDNDDFEFIEIANITDQPIDLAGVTVVSTGEGGVDFDFRFAAADRLGPGEVMLIVEDQHAFEFRYGSDLPVVGEWSGRLSNGGETITILGDNQLIQQLTYDDEWHTTTDGSGPSLEIVDRFDQDSEVWSDSSGWLPSTETGGTPGSLEFTPANIPGDSNRDGVFDSSDLVVVFRAAEYEDDIDGNSTFEEGDWNGDGDFNTTDLVFAFQAGTYVAKLRPIFAADVDAEFASRKQRDRVFSQFAWIEEDDSENDTFADYS